MNKILVAAATFLTLILAAAVSSADTVSEDFNAPTSDWQYNGAAFQDLVNGRGVLILDGWMSHSTSIFYKTPVYISKLQASFDFYVGLRVSPGADGLTFCVMDSAYNSFTRMGGGGNGMGYEGINHSGAVEFDTCYNVGSDPNSNHVGIDQDGSIASLAVNAAIPILEDGQMHHADIDFDNGRFLVYLDGPLVLDYTMAGFTPFNGYIGFTAGTGGETNDHYIDNFDLSTPYRPVVPEPASMALLGLGLFGFVRLIRKGVR